MLHDRLAAHARKTIGSVREHSQLSVCEFSRYLAQSRSSRGGITRDIAQINFVVLEKADYNGPESRKKSKRLEECCGQIIRVPLSHYYTSASQGDR